MAPRTPAQRAADRRYNAKVAAQYKLVSCKLKAEEAAAFKAACKQAGTTPNAVLTKAIRDYINK